MKLSIIIPAYNEEKRIGRILEEYCKFFRNLKEEGILNFEILVVLNACKDNTLNVVKEFQIKFKEIKFLDFGQGGKGFAIIEGFKEVLKKDFELIGFVDADMATSPEAFYDLVKNIENYGGIIASRWIKGAKIYKQTFKRKVLSRGFNFIVRSLFLIPYRDTQCGAKLFKRKVIEKITSDLTITQWAFDVNLLFLCKKNNFKVKEIPTVWEDKEESKINIAKTPFQMFSGVVRLRIIYSLFKRSIKIYDKLPEKIKIHH